VLNTQLLVARAAILNISVVCSHNEQFKDVTNIASILCCRYDNTGIVFVSPRLL